MNLEEKSTMKVSDISLYFLASTNLKEEVAFFWSDSLISED